MIDEKSPMADVLSAMSQAEAGACHEFCRRQRAENLPALADGAQMLGRVAFNLQCERPAELMAWKSPETYEPIPDSILPRALDAAAEGDADAVHALLKELDFATITAIASAASHLDQAASHLLAYPDQRVKADPQGQLF